ncbi:MAG: hypothetical protein ACI4CS_07180 [Candidatus Weimeria sp.]
MENQGIDIDEFRETITHTKIPVLVLDQKWHRLFALEGKPDDIKEAEVRENEILKEQGKLNNEVKDLKAVKKKLMKNIVDNMDNSAGAKKTSMANVGDMIDETNEKIAADEDRLLEIPKELKEANDNLMVLTAKYAYERMRTNTSEVNEIAEWIKKIRVELKTNIIKKQNREINNREIYAYMHDIFGKEMLGLFDIKADTPITLTSRDSYMADVQPNDDGGEKGEWRSKKPEESLNYKKKSDKDVSGPGKENTKDEGSDGSHESDGNDDDDEGKGTASGKNS